MALEKEDMYELMSKLNLEEEYLDKNIQTMRYYIQKSQTRDILTMRILILMKH